jgi:Ion channel
MNVEVPIARVSDPQTVDHGGRTAHWTDDGVAARCVLRAASGNCRRFHRARVFPDQTAVFVSALTGQVRSIVGAKYPGIRAVEAIGVALPLLVILFAIAYVSMAVADPANFSVQLSRSASLYFTITVLSTVGFGDIVPRTDPARLVVSLQMLLDLVLIGVILKVIVGAARTGLERQRGEPEDSRIGSC